jgi:hypothetical protein
MKCSVGLLGLVSVGSAAAFTGAPLSFASKRVYQSSKSSLSMVLEKPVEKKLAKIEMLKVVSDHLVKPLKEVCLLLRKEKSIVVFVVAM